MEGFWRDRTEDRPGGQGCRGYKGQRESSRDKGSTVLSFMAAVTRESQYFVGISKCIVLASFRFVPLGLIARRLYGKE